MLPAVRGVARVIMAALVAAGPTAARAQPQPQKQATGPEDADRALALATYAFEYRDFARVIATLDPWVHPPRIADRAKLAEAQRLLGVSLHVTGEMARAEQEFARVLEHDPRLQLDPFLVPPAVIDTFERVRTSMRPVLDRILADREKRPLVVAPPPPKPARALSPVFAYAPLGLSHFLALEEPGWGALWLSLQTIGLATNAGGYWAGRGVIAEDGHLDGEADQNALDTATKIQVTGLAVFAVAWIASGLHAHARWPDTPAE